MEQSGKGLHFDLGWIYFKGIRPEGFLEGLHVGREIREEVGMTQCFVL